MDKRSFYEILANNVKPTVKEESTPKKFHPGSIIASKITILMINVCVMWFSWSQVNEAMNLPYLTFMQILFLYLVVKIMFKGLF